MRHTTQYNTNNNEIPFNLAIRLTEILSPFSTSSTERLIEEVT